MRYVVLTLILLLSSCAQLNKNDTPHSSNIEHTVVENISQDITPCPSDMVVVEGDYCPNLFQVCARWMDAGQTRFGNIRCAEWAPNPKCLTSRRPMHYCIDKEEWTDVGQELPKNDINWLDAKTSCESIGKRLCTEEEWTLACEGKEEFGYPYGSKRDSAICNIDSMHLLDASGSFIDKRVSIKEFPNCLSPFGVHDIVGNVDEWVYRLKQPQPHRSGLMGGWWGPVRNRCRAETTKHDEFFHEIQIGFRCCKDIMGL